MNGNKVWLVYRHAPWKVGEVRASVVVASTGVDARQLASERHRAEGADVWLDPKRSRCSRLSTLVPRVALQSVKEV